MKCDDGHAYNNVNRFDLRRPTSRRRRPTRKADQHDDGDIEDYFARGYRQTELRWGLVVERNQQDLSTTASESEDSEAGEPPPPGVIRSDHIPGRSSPTRKRPAAYRTLADAPGRGARGWTTLEVGGGEPHPQRLQPVTLNSNHSTHIPIHVLYYYTVHCSTCTGSTIHSTCTCIHTLSTVPLRLYCTYLVLASQKCLCMVECM